MMGKKFEDTGVFSNSSSSERQDNMLLISSRGLYTAANQIVHTISESQVFIPSLTSIANDQRQSRSGVVIHDEEESTRSPD
jgi:hypothetical protein